MAGRALASPAQGPTGIPGFNPSTSANSSARSQKRKHSSLTCIILYSGITYKFPCSAMKQKYRNGLTVFFLMLVFFVLFSKCYLTLGLTFCLVFWKDSLKNPTLAGRLLPLTFPTVNAGDDSKRHPSGFSLPIHKHLIVRQRAKALSDLKALCSCSWSSRLFLAHLYYVSSLHNNTSQTMVTLQTSPSY